MYVVAANRCSVHNLKQSNLASPIVNGVHNEDFNTYPNVRAAIASLKEDRCLSPGSCSCYDEGCRGCCSCDGEHLWTTAGDKTCRRTVAAYQWAGGPHPIPGFEHSVLLLSFPPSVCHIVSPAQEPTKTNLNVNTEAAKLLELFGKRRLSFRHDS
ncbi:hypothetical protein F2P81_002212 [Scophthalmus maximus]|uniref:Uncharacterized protein n=1 Tax=Scophthalmus maximus TaxID=52904 RepID=A0A6A4TI79_SCOMX|nr:hypothetical protein F2P81_002212 [Scophthalmus maximus]